MSVQVELFSNSIIRCNLILSMENSIGDTRLQNNVTFITILVYGHVLIFSQSKF